MNEDWIWFQIDTKLRINQIRFMTAQDMIKWLETDQITDTYRSLRARLFLSYHLTYVLWSRHRQKSWTFFVTGSGSEPWPTELWVRVELDRISSPEKNRIRIRTVANIVVGPVSEWTNPSLQKKKIQNPDPILLQIRIPISFFFQYLLIYIRDKCYRGILWTYVYNCHFFTTFTAVPSF